MIRILAPAKINLGLEVLGKRSDGYHEIRTVFCAVSLFDRISISRSDSSRVYCTPIAGMVENLADRALALAYASCPDLPGARVSIAKRIPAAAGLGGASSDAAAALLGLNALSDNRLTSTDMASLARACGSDVPFFLHGGLAVGSGRGDALLSLPHRPLHAVVIAPRVTILDKTCFMYSQLRSSDWSDGHRIDSIAHAIIGGLTIPESMLGNAFEAALYGHLPEVKELADCITGVLGRRPNVSGAGPALYALCSSAGAALAVRSVLKAAIPSTVARLYCVRSVSGMLSQEQPDA